MNEKEHTLESESKGRSPGGSDDTYHKNLLEQYKLYVEMTDRISSRRQSANSFFFSINTAFLAATGFIWAEDVIEPLSPWFLALTVGGLVICFSWSRLIKSYKNLNRAKFDVIHLMEDQLPFTPFKKEWEILGRASHSERYYPFTNVETVIPRIFSILYLAIAAMVIYFLMC